MAVLTEGYDDPTVNAVVMATPSQSKLYYMQAMGRAIRLDVADPLKKAYCIEVEDDLPNIRYRIDNRWLFSDVSDDLEPAVVDVEYGTETQFNNAIESLFDRFGVPPELPRWDPRGDQRIGTAARVDQSSRGRNSTPAGALGQDWKALLRSAAGCLVTGAGGLKKGVHS